MVGACLLFSLVSLSCERGQAAVQGKTRPWQTCAMLGLRGGANEALEEVRSVMHSGYVSSMVFSDEDEVVSEDMCGASCFLAPPSLTESREPLQVLPVGYDNSSSLDRDLRCGTWLQGPAEEAAGR
eukprot:709052-Hanusia_phi.AAC.1